MKFRPCGPAVCLDVVEAEALVLREKITQECLVAFRGWVAYICSLPNVRCSGGDDGRRGAR